MPKRLAALYTGHRRLTRRQMVQAYDGMGVDWDTKSETANTSPSSATVTTRANARPQRHRTDRGKANRATR